MRTLIALIMATVGIEPSRNNAKGDMSCMDRSYALCKKTLHPSHVEHAKTVEDCHRECEMENTVGACDWFLWEEDAAYSTCQLFAESMEISMEAYFEGCFAFGSPLFDFNNNCFADSEGLCNFGACDPGKCHFCDKEEDNICYGIGLSGCTLVEGGKQISNITSSDQCHHSCSNEAGWRYFTWNSVEPICSCHMEVPVDTNCKIVVVKQGADVAKIHQCISRQIQTTTPDATSKSTTLSTSTGTTKSTATSVTAATSTPSLTTNKTTPASSTTTEVPDCPLGWLNAHADGCFTFLGEHTGLSWIDADSACEQVGGYLAEPKYKSQMEFISGLARLETEMTGVRNWWIGLTDFSHEGTWIWQHSNQVVQDEFWDAGSPHNSSANDLDCAKLTLLENNHLVWRDSTCGSEMIAPLCQRIDEQ